ncbi:BREX system serine/threonine kinase PglW [Nonomuraea glycinis]|uniref:non-specific serine/threonine protein kinase n=1 Tax=Nonomuraea glycinis TaxID=2047744 RepID=A0A918AAJ4_9ACTN|nr:BREX system serine/threonine kinase PglW [Nonomuraea glycinis]MCA2181015.1 BREX system serine/threonine kinase PglW [Nonomuraea glycinis]GGP13222.1 protein kinase [Nonomuraea glycinis]
MEPGSKRWVEVTPSEHAHERGGLAGIRARLADADPYRAWSNFTFTTRSGRQYEVDLLVIGKGGIYLLELKHWSGTITGDHQTWFHNGDAEDNPRILADNKAKHFKQLLLDAGGRDLPFVHAGVVLHQPDAQVRLTERGRRGVYRIDGQGPGGLDELVKDALAAEPRMPRDLINGRRSAELARLIEKAGVRRSVRHRKVGNMLLEDDPLAEGPGWQDYLAKHPVLERVRRVRFYLVNQAASQEDRSAILRAAKREFVTLENLNHPGIARAIEFYEHERGPAVVFEHDPTETRLDHFLQQKAGELTVDQRIDLVRTLANTLRYAHSRRLVHRRLSPLSIFVRTLAYSRYGVRIRDWHTAGQLVPGSPSHSTYVAGTRTLEALTDKGAHGYIAPETLHNPAADAILADVFGLGAVSYLVFTGSAPAETSEVLQQRLARERGLDVAVELDGAAQAMIDLVKDATAGDVDLRTESVERFVQGLEQLVGELTATEEAAQQVDPLDAVPGSKIGPADDPVRFEVVERLGQGSTALALLVKDTKKAEDAKHGQAVLKVALDEDGARKRLLDEAEVLPLVRDLRIAGNLEEPMLVGGRTALLLENAGRESLAAMIRREGRLSLDFLGRWGKDLLEILSALDLAGVNHRDIKPDNLAFRELGKSREVHLTLFDFSLSRAPLEQTGVGTPPYLDPFFDPVHRPRYDAAAERYAAAVTLHEMATGQAPAYGTGNSHPALIDSDVTIDPDAFEPGPARDGVIAFLRKALARNVADRHDSIESMRIEWRAVFDAVPPAAATPTSVNPVTGQELDEAAGRAALDTLLASAGLTPRAVDALHRIDVRTVRDLLARSPFELSRLSGVADPTKREIRRRAKQWRARLQSSAPVAVAEDDNPAGSGRGVDAVLRSLISKAAKQDSTEARVLRLYLGLEETESAWPSNTELGSAAGVTAGRAGQILPTARKGWRQRRSLTEVRDEIVDLVADAGGVLSAEGIAEALLTSRGSETAGDQRTRRALGLVRAAVEVEGERGGEARLLHRRCHDSAVVALEKPTDPDAVPGTDLLDYAVRLGKVADLLAAEDPLPSAAQTETVLRGVRLPQGMAELPADRLAALGAAASEKAAANGRGEIYPHGIDPRRALEQLASSLGVVRHGMDLDQLKARVRARYPKVGDLPESRHDLDALLHLAKVPLVFSGGVYRPRDIQTSNLPTSHWPTRTRLRGGSSVDRNFADFERQMEVSLQERGSVTISVDYPLYVRAIPALRDRFGLQVLDVTAELLTAMRASADAYNVDWSIVLRADRPDAAPQDVANLRRLVELAAAGLEEMLLTDPAPLLVVEAAPLARYDRLTVLERLADKATARPAARWLLVPVDRDGRPYLDHRPAPGALGALRLSTTWVNGHQQSAAS